MGSLVRRIGGGKLRVTSRLSPGFCPQVSGFSRFPKFRPQDSLAAVCISEHGHGDAVKCVTWSGDVAHGAAGVANDGMRLNTDIQGAAWRS